MSNALTCYLVAGEPSGDALGAGLMAALKARCDAQFFGVGGEGMEAQGLSSLFSYHELALMGFVEIVPHLMSLMARVNLVAEDILAKRPDVVVTIDSPGFNFLLAKKLRASRHALPKLVHYVAPSVWAYKPKRAAKCARLFDHMLCLLPFEPKYFEAEGLAATFVGHPVAYLPGGNGAAFRSKYRIPPEATLITLLPGSREGEIRRHMPIFGPAIVALAKRHPQLALAVPVAQRYLPRLAEFLKGCPFQAVAVSDEADKRDAFAASQLALVKSGTVSLEVAEARVPQVVAYRANPVTVWVVRRMMRIPYVNLINVLADRPIIPELLQGHCTPRRLAEALANLLENREAAQMQVALATEQLARLRLADGVHPADSAAEAVLGVL